MNQTQKRLSIINHAISITDVETIQLQVLKLALLKSDMKIQEIVTALQAENYAQAQGLINQYIDAPTDNILQRTSQKAQAVMSEEDQAIIDEFDLFITSKNTVETPQEVDINDFLLDELPVRRKVETKKVDHDDVDSLRNIDMDTVLTDNIELDISHISNDTFFDSSKEKNKQTIDTSHIPEDTFFDTQESTKEEPEIPKEETIAQESETPTQKEMLSEEEPVEELKPVIKTEEEARTFNYKAIPFIAQKFLTMKKQYPPIEITYEKFDSVENLLRKIPQEGYSEKEIEEILIYIKKLTEESQEIEAAQLLLICAATESKFAQFMLARELYKGILLTKNIPEAFTQMHNLALEEYPEALCDIAQFCEHGIGTDKDKQKAEQFYKEAMEFGIKRAEKHYNRLKKQNRGLFKR